MRWFYIHKEKQGMAKSTKEQLEKDEIKVLTQLQLDANASIDVLAKRCGFSRQKTWRIVKQLEKNRWVWGYTAVADDEKQGRSHFMLLIKRSSTVLDKKIVDKIDSITLEDFAVPYNVSIESSSFVHGKYDWVITFTARDIRFAKKFCDSLLKGFPGAIHSMDLIQTIYCVRKQYIFNPSRKRLRELMA